MDDWTNKRENNLKQRRIINKTNETLTHKHKDLRLKILLRNIVNDELFEKV